MLALAWLAATPADAAAEPAARLGWLDGRCLVIDDAGIVAGTPVVLVLIDGKAQKIRKARVGKPTRDGADCPALMAGRAATNAKARTIFYTLEAGAVDTNGTGIGVGIVGADTGARMVGGQVRADVRHDGKPVVFSACSTSEGISFAAWDKKAYRGAPLWSAYYALDYDTQPTCR